MLNGHWCGCLCRDRFGTSRKANSEKLTQVWTLNRRYRVGALKQRKFRILDEGRNNSALALAKGHYQERELVSDSDAQDIFSLLQHLSLQIMHSS